MFPVSAGSPSSFKLSNCSFFSFGQFKTKDSFSCKRNFAFKGPIKLVVDCTSLLWFDEFPNEAGCLDRIYSKARKSLFRELIRKWNYPIFRNQTTQPLWLRRELPELMGL